MNLYRHYTTVGITHASDRPIAISGWRSAFPRGSTPRLPPPNLAFSARTAGCPALYSASARAVSPCGRSTGRCRHGRGRPTVGPSSLWACLHATWAYASISPLRVRNSVSGRGALQPPLPQAAAIGSRTLYLTTPALRRRKEPWSPSSPSLWGLYYVPRWPGTLIITSLETGMPTTSLSWHCPILKKMGWSGIIIISASVPGA
ncbi:hypothetical protein V8F33_010229 [Rhypophila sp. PSN 637]